ncbi:molybdate ABC transporter substrate-binding protein [Sulfurimonas sp.]
MPKTLFLLLLLSLQLFGKTLSVAVAANMSYAIEALKVEFEKEHPQTKVQITLGSSGKLTSQIKYGAPYDIFMSANMKYPDALCRDGKTLSKVHIYAKGSLVLFSRQERDFAQGIRIILNADIKRVAVGNPKTAPYGKATKEALVHAKIYEEVKNKFVYGESIAQTLTYTLKATELGFIAKSSLYAKNMRHFKKNKHWIDVDTKLYKPISQGVVLLKRAQNNSDAKLFYKFIFSHKAKKIFKKFGYTTL